MKSGLAKPTKLLSKHQNIVYSDHFCLWFEWLQEICLNLFAWKPFPWKPKITCELYAPEKKNYFIILYLLLQIFWL